MGVLQVAFEIPSEVERGLASGALERVGGVIRDSSTKHVVSWLRDSGVFQATVDSSTNTALINPTNTVLSASQQGASLLNISPNSLSSLTQLANQANSQLAKIGQFTSTLFNGNKQLSQQVTYWGQLTAAGQMVNLAMTGLSFVVLLQRLEVLRGDIQKLQAVVLKEFKRDRDNTFEVALEAAHDAWSLDDKNQRDHAARSAIDGLKRARNDFLTDFQEVMSSGKELDAERLKLAQAQLQRAIYAQIAIARSYWAMGTPQKAIAQLSEQAPKFKAYTSQIVQARMKPNELTMYFEQSIPAEKLAQAINIYYWISGQEGRVTPQFMFAMMDSIRSNFFNADVFGNFIQRMSSSWRDPLLQDLDLSMALIENVQRLEGYELEIRTANLSLEQWDSLVDADKLKEYGGALIVDTDALSRAISHLS